MNTTEWLALIAVGLTALGFFERIARYLLRGQYATREYVEVKLRPLEDALMLEASNRKDLETEVKLIKLALKHLPTIGHIDDVRERVSELSQGQAVKHAENKSEMQHIRSTLEEIREDLRRRYR